MYQYNSIMSAVNDFIDEVNESDSEAKLVKPHTIKDAYELLAEYYGKESGAELLKEYESGRPHDVADATKLLLDVLKGSRKETEKIYARRIVISDGAPIQVAGPKGSDDGCYLTVPEGTKIGVVNCWDWAGNLSGNSKNQELEYLIFINTTANIDHYYILNGVKQSSDPFFYKSINKNGITILYYSCGNTQRFNNVTSYPGAVQYKKLSYTHTDPYDAYSRSSYPNHTDAELTILLFMINQDFNNGPISHINQAQLR